MVGFLKGCNKLQFDFSRNADDVPDESTSPFDKRKYYKVEKRYMFITGIPGAVRK